MTTSSVTLRAIASSSNIPSSWIVDPRRFAFWCMVLQALADYGSVLTGVCVSWALLSLAEQTPKISHTTANVVVCANFVALALLLLLHFLGVYKYSPGPLNILETERLVRGVSIMFVVVAPCVWSVGSRTLSMSLLALGVPTVLCSLIAQRKLTRALTRRLQRKGYGVRRALIYCKAHDQLPLPATPYAPPLGWEWVGTIHDGPAPASAAAGAHEEAVGGWSDLECIVNNHKITDIVVFEPELTAGALESILKHCERFGLRLTILPSRSDARRYLFKSSSFGDTSIRRTSKSATTRTFGDLAKRALDLVLSSGLLVLLAPFLLIIAVLVKLNSPGPIFFRHTRVGKNGRPFEIWKFRSMHAAAPLYEHSPHSDSDPRLTRVGRFLRRYSLDELPQLINVWNGEMSLVGPRPEMPFIVEGYGHVERRRLEAQPGMTGLWQISPARAMPIHENIEYDLFYIERRTFFLDLAILLGTVMAVLRGVDPTGTVCAQTDE